MNARNVISTKEEQSSFPRGTKTTVRLLSHEATSDYERIYTREAWRALRDQTGRVHTYGKTEHGWGQFQTTFGVQIPRDGVTSISLFLDVETERQHLSSKPCWLAQKLAFRSGERERHWWMLDLHNFEGVPRQMNADGQRGWNKKENDGGRRSKRGITSFENEEGGKREGEHWHRKKMGDRERERERERGTGDAWKV